MTPTKKYAMGGPMGPGDGNPTPEAKAIPSPQVDYRGDLPMYSGVATARPDILFDALMLAKEAPAVAMGLARAARNPRATMNVIKEGASALKNRVMGSGAGALDDEARAFLRTMDDYDANLSSASDIANVRFPFSDAEEVSMYGRMLKSGLGPDDLAMAGHRGAASRMRSLMDEGLLDISEEGMRAAARAVEANVPTSGSAMDTYMRNLPSAREAQLELLRRSQLPGARTVLNQ